MSSRKGKEKVKPRSKKNPSTLSASLDPPPARVPHDSGSLSIHMFMPTPSMVPPAQSHPIQSPSDMVPPIHSHPGVVSSTQFPSNTVPTSQSLNNIGHSIHSTPTMVGSPQPQPMVSPTHHSPIGPSPPPSHPSHRSHGFQSTSTETTSTTIGTSYQRIQLGPDENIIPMPGGT